MGSSAFLNDQARVNRKFILNLSQNSQIYPSSRKSVQQNTSYLDLFPKKKKPRKTSIKKWISVWKWSHEFTVSCSATTQLQHNTFKQRWVPNGNKNNLPSRFPLADDANFCDSTLLFCRGRLWNEHSFKRHIVLPIRPRVLPRPHCRRRLGLLRFLLFEQARRNLPRRQPRGCQNVGQCWASVEQGKNLLLQRRTTKPQTPSVR